MGQIRIRIRNGSIQLFMSDNLQTSPATWRICRYRYQYDTLFLFICRVGLQYRSFFFLMFNPEILTNIGSIPLLRIRLRIRIRIIKHTVCVWVCVCSCTLVCQCLYMSEWARVMKAGVPPQLRRWVWAWPTLTEGEKYHLRGGEVIGRLWLHRPPASLWTVIGESHGAF